MYAVFATGGKQYRAAPGDRIKVEKLDAEEGAKVKLDQVMLVADGDDVTVGAPLVDGGLVEATVVSHGRGDKIKIVKFKRRKHHRKQMGHRQWFTELEIVGVSAGGKTAKAESAPKKKAEPKKDEPEKAESKKAEPKKAAPKKAAPKPEKAEASAEIVAIKFLDEPNGEPDDLQKISGVGPVLERKLNGMGIFHYRQIAAFTPEQIEQVDDALNFKGRIERDNWLQQAAELAAAKED